MRPFYQLQVIFAVFCVSLLAGCSSGKKSELTPFLSPPAPKATAFAVTTENYFYNYDEGLGSPPFNPYWQFADQHYPITVSYEKKTTDPALFELVSDTEKAIRCWAKADPRVCIISGLSPSAARVQVILTDKIVYNGQTNIIGLTTVMGDNVPSFKVEVATKYLATGGDANNPGDYIEMPADEVAKTLAHELGHALGLGHSPDTRDLMHYRASYDQGASYSTYLTFGDAMAIWTTLNGRQINWNPTQPTITPATQPYLSTNRSPVGPRGETVCVYTKP